MGQAGGQILTETVPCPVGHPSTAAPETEISHDPSVTLEQPVGTDAFVTASDTVALEMSEADGPPDDPPGGWHWDEARQAWVVDDVPHLEVVLAGPVDDAYGYLLELPDGATEQLWHGPPLTLEPLPADLTADDLVGEALRVVAVSDREPELDDSVAPTAQEIRQVSPPSESIEIRNAR